ncbi:MAG TPA: signal peptidase I [Verrucomicrobiae bacterium]
MDANSITASCNQTATEVAVWKDEHSGRRSWASPLQFAFQGVAIVCLLVASYWFFSHFVIQSVRVSGISMAPTLGDEDFYLVNRAACLFRAPQRGEIVVLRDPTDQTYAVKRVIGAAGDTVDLRDGKIFLNGEQLDETYLPKGTQTFPFTTLRLTVQCGPDQYFVLGDNRFFSSDSRSYGPVRRDAILGFVVR